MFDPLVGPLALLAASEAIVVMTTFGDREAAGKLAVLLVQARLAACVQILGPMESTYTWEEKLETTTEWLCLIKTARDKRDDLLAAIKSHHPYDVPEMLVLPVEGGYLPYLDWLKAQTRP